jgi:hypothetical protein
MNLVGLISKAPTTLEKSLEKIMAANEDPALENYLAHL